MVKFCLNSEECLNDEGCYDDKFHGFDIRKATSLLREDFKALPDHTEKYLNKRLKMIFGDALVGVSEQ